MSREPNKYALSITDENGLRVGPLRIVRAASRAQAIRHVAKDTITARLATVEDGIEAGQLGIEIEDATKDEEEEG